MNCTGYKAELTGQVCKKLEIDRLFAIPRLDVWQSSFSLPLRHPLHVVEAARTRAFLRCWAFLSGALLEDFVDCEHFLHGAISLVDRDIGVSVAVRIGVGNGDAAKRLAADHAGSF
jgi:hypothetical protein